MNTKRSFRNPINFAYNEEVIKKLCTPSEKYLSKPKKALQLYIPVSSYQLVKNLISQLKSLVLQNYREILTKSDAQMEDIEIDDEEFIYLKNQSVLVIPFRVKQFEGQSFEEKCQKFEFLLFSVDQEDQGFLHYLKEFGGFVERLGQGLGLGLGQGLGLGYCQKQEGGFGSELEVVQGKQMFRVQVYLRKCQVQYFSCQEQRDRQYSLLGEQVGKLVKSCRDLYLPGLNQNEFDLNLHNQFRMNAENIQFNNQEVEQAEREALDEFEMHEIEQEKVLIKQLINYYKLQFEQKVLPYLNKFRQNISLSRLNDNLELSLDMVRNGFEIENLVNVICGILVNKNIEEKQDTINLVVQAYNKEIQLKEKEIQVLFYLITNRICSEICYNMEFRNEARWILKRLIKTNPLQFENEIREACGLQLLFEKDVQPDYSEFLEKRKEKLLKNMPLFFTKSHPVKIYQGAYQYLYDDYGRTFIDCANNVQHAGHGHPLIARAGIEQMSNFNSNTRFLNDNIVNYAQHLLKEAFPPELQVALFCNSGSEANDMALNICRTLTGSQDIIVMDHSYHGTTIAVQEISVTKFQGKGGCGQKDYIHIIEMPCQYRGKFGYEDPESGEKYALQVKELIENLKKQGRKPAAFICESMPAVGGMTLLPPGYLKAVYRYVREAGGICIADEVQSGFGRVAKHWWAYELQDVVPDIVVLGKPMGNGHPVAGLVMKQDIADQFNNGQPYFNTYGGNPVSMKIADEVLKCIKNEKMRENAEVVGKYLGQEFKKLCENFEIIGDVRGTGLFYGIEIVKDKVSREPSREYAENFSNQLKHKGFIMLHEGYNYNVLKLKPALTFSLDNARELIKAFREILESKLYMSAYYTIME